MMSSLHLRDNKKKKNTRISIGFINEKVGLEDGENKCTMKEETRVTEAKNYN